MAAQWFDNLALGLYTSMAEHPLDRLRRAGVAVSVNTDDSCCSGSPLPGEYACCVEAHGWSRDDLRCAGRTSLEARLANTETKTRLLTQLQAL